MAYSNCTAIRMMHQTKNEICLLINSIQSCCIYTTCIFRKSATFSVGWVRSCVNPTQCKKIRTHSRPNPTRGSTQPTNNSVHRIMNYTSIFKSYANNWTRNRWSLIIYKSVDSKPNFRLFFYDIPFLAFLT